MREFERVSGPLSRFTDTDRRVFEIGCEHLDTEHPVVVGEEAVIELAKQKADSEHSCKHIWVKELLLHIDVERYRASGSPPLPPLPGR